VNDPSDAIYTGIVFASLLRGINNKGGDLVQIREPFGIEGAVASV